MPGWDTSDNETVEPVGPELGTVTRSKCAGEAELALVVFCAVVVFPGPKRPGSEPGAAIDPLITQSGTGVSASPSRCLTTLMCASLTVLVIVQVPTAMVALQVPGGEPLPVYPGMSASVAVQVALSVVYPLTVKWAGSASEAVGSSATTLPEVHDKPTVTPVSLLSEKSLATVKVEPTCLLVKVHVTCEWPWSSSSSPRLIVA